MAKVQGKVQVKAKPDPERLLAVIKPREAINAFKDHAAVWQKASIHVVASATICLIVGTYSRDKIDHDTTILKLKAEVAETGIKEAQIYKYVGLSRALVGHILTKASDLLQPILRAKEHDVAMAVIMTWLDKQGIRSLDGLGTLLGKYQRSDTPENSPTLAPTTPILPTEAQPTKAGSANILARLNLEPEILSGLPAETIVANFVKSGHSAEELLEATLPYIASVRVCTKAMAKIQKRLETLKSPANA